jgi:hypothetical protein
VQKPLQLLVVSHTTMPLYKLFKITKLCSAYLGCVPRIFAYGERPNFNYR